MGVTTLWLTGVETSARADRQILTDLYTEGVKNVQGNQFKVVPRAAGANMSVTVRKGDAGNAVAYITGDDIDGQGLYRSEMDADIPDVVIAAAPSSGTRTDLVVWETVDKAAIGGTVNESRARVLTGVSALTAAHKTMIALASISVAAGQSSIQTANITDLRSQAGAAALKVGTQAQPFTTTQRLALTGGDLFDGRLVEDTTLGRTFHYVNGAWAAVGATKATGTYTGTGVTGRTIAVGFTPDLVLVSPKGGGNGIRGVSWLHSTDATAYQTLQSSNGNIGLGTLGDRVVSGGFIIGSDTAGYSTNTASEVYVWTAFKLT